MGTAERADIIVDFSGFAGQKMILYSDAPALSRWETQLNDYFLGNRRLQLHSGRADRTPGRSCSSR